MKAFPSKTHLILITITLLGVFLVSAINSPSNTDLIQNTPEPTLNNTQLVEDDLMPESGDTDGIIWGAGIILFIIVGGVIIQRIINKPDPDHLNKNH
jgi:hypothetical protein